MSTHHDIEIVDTTIDNSIIDSDKSEAVEVSHTGVATSNDELYFWVEPGVCG